MILASEAVYGSPLTLPGELVDVPELLPDAVIRKVNRAIDGFAVPPPHHVRPVSPVQLLSALLTAKYVFVREDAVISSLAPRYRGPYLVIDRQSKYFRLHIGSKQDVVSLDRLKPVFSDAPVTPTLPPSSPVASSPDPPPRNHTRNLGSSSFPKFFRHLYLHDGILTGLQEIKGSAPPFPFPSGGTTVAAMKVVLVYESYAAARRLGGVSD